MTGAVPTTRTPMLRFIYARRHPTPESAGLELPRNGWGLGVGRGVGEAAETWRPQALL